MITLKRFALVLAIAIAWWFLSCRPTQPCEGVLVIHPDSTWIGSGDGDSSGVEVCGE